MLPARWGLAVFSELIDGGRRYQDLCDVLAGISHKMLTETLRRTERDGLIGRHIDGERIETATPYELNRSRPLNWPAIEAARQRWDRLRQAEG
jgi:DNA-binding HxlR family transcriptional regulator